MSYTPTPSSRAELMGSRRAVCARGLRFACYTAGPKHGPIALLLHGFADTATTWSGLMPTLAHAGFRVIAPNLRGYPPTTFPEDGRYGPLEHGEDVLGLLDALGADDAVVVGHDWGAMSGTLAAVMAPQRISRLVSLAMPHPSAHRPTCKVLWRRHHLFPSQRRRAAVEFLRGGGVDELWRRWSPSWTPPAEELRPVRAMLRVDGAVEAALEYFWAYDEDVARPEVQRVLRGTVETPTLAFGGVEDAAVPLARFDQAASAYTGSYRWVGVDGAGHFPHRERPDVVLPEIVRFLRGSTEIAARPSADGYGRLRARRPRRHTQGIPWVAKHGVTSDPPRR